MRIAELATAVVLMGLSVWFMVLATALPIGWVPGAGPGGGAFPFWLSAGMFVCAALILWRETRVAPRFKRVAIFIHPAASGQMAVAAGGLVAMVALLPIVGAYIAIPAFMVGYLKVIGKTGWLTPILLSVGTILFMFFFFEVSLKILLPKGWTEPWFYPLYAMFF